MKFAILHRSSDLQSGFTLLEMLVALAIAALLYAAVAPHYATSQSTDVKRTAIATVTLLKANRARALKTNQQTSVVFDSEKRQLIEPGYSKPTAYPDRVNFDVDNPNLASTNPAVIRFFEDGSSTNGRIIVSWNSSSCTIVINGLTGSATIEKCP